LHAEQFADKQWYPWFLRIESANEETGAFEGYCMYPSISEAARISCSGTVDVVEEDSSGCIGVLKFAEGSFVSGFEDHQILVESSSVGSLKLYRIPPGGQYTLSMRPAPVPGLVPLAPPAGRPSPHISKYKPRQALQQQQQQLHEKRRKIKPRQRG
jgi:hypothetical protein